jgi:hypothetical protein
MTRHVNGFADFLHEREEPARDELQDLKRLRGLGLVGQVEYLEGLFDWAERSGQSVESMLEPGEVYFELEVDEVSEEGDIVATKEWISSWSGAKGEFIVLAKGTVGEDALELDLTLSTGAKVRFGWHAYDEDGAESWIEFRGRQSFPDAGELEDAEDAYMDHDDWETYMHTRLHAILNSSY